MSVPSTLTRSSTIMPSEQGACQRASGYVLAYVPYGHLRTCFANFTQQDYSTISVAPLPWLLQRLGGILRTGMARWGRGPSCLDFRGRTLFGFMVHHGAPNGTFGLTTTEAERWRGERQAAGRRAMATCGSWHRFVPCPPHGHKLLGAPDLTTRSKDATRGSWHRY